MKLFTRLMILFTIQLFVAPPIATGFQGGRTIRIEGCYTDTELIQDESLVVGSGTLTIKKRNGIYVGTFVQLMDDGGASYDYVQLKNLVIDSQRRTMSFRLPVFVDGAKIKEINVRGTINSRGIRLRFSEQLFNYGEPNPFMKKVACGK